VEGFDEAHDVWENGLLQNLLFLNHSFLHFFLLDVFLGETLYSEQVCAELDVFYKVDLAELALA